MVCPTSDRFGLNAGWGKYEVSLEALVCRFHHSHRAHTDSLPYQRPHSCNGKLQPSSTAICCHEQPRATCLGLNLTVRISVHLGYLAAWYIYTVPLLRVLQTHQYRNMLSRSWICNLWWHMRQFRSPRIALVSHTATMCRLQFVVHFILRVLW